MSKDTEKVLDDVRSAQYGLALIHKLFMLPLADNKQIAMTMFEVVSLIDAAGRKLDAVRAELGDERAIEDQNKKGGN